MGPTRQSPTRPSRPFLGGSGIERFAPGNSLIWALGLLLAVAGAAAASPKREAEAHLERAFALDRAGDRRAAIAEFERAYAIYPQPNLLFNIARAYHFLAAAGHRPDIEMAIAHYRRYLREKKAPPDRRAVEGHLRQLEAKLATLGQPAPAPATPAPPPPDPPLREPPALASPAPAPTIAPAAAPPAPVIPAPAAPAATVIVADPVVERPPSPPAAEPSRRGPTFRLGLGLVAAGLVVAAGGGASLGAGQWAWGSAKGGATLEQRDGRRGLGQNLVLTGAVLAAVGGVALLGGVVMMVLPQREARRGGLWIAPSLGGLVAGGTF